MKMSVKEAFEDMKLQREIKIVRYTSRIPEDSPYIRIFVTRWELDRMMPQSGDYECRVSASIRLPDGEKVDFGSVRGKASVFQSMIRGSGRDYRDYKKSSDDALDKLKQRIIERLSPDARGAKPPPVDE